MSTPGVKWTAAEVNQMETEEVLEHRISEYRALVARGNYLCQDRLDIMYAVKERSRDTAAPNESNVRALKRLVRYLKQNPRYVNGYPDQEIARR